MENKPQIKVGHDEKTNLYVIPNRNWIIINGNRNKPETIYYNNTQVLITSIKPETYQTYSTKLVTTGWVDNDKETMTPEEYDFLLKELQSKGEFIDEFDDDYCNKNGWNFKEVEDEVKYRHFIKRWTKVQKQVEEITDYEITIIKVPVSEYEYIQPLASLEDIDSCEKALFKYTPNPRKYLKDYCESLGLIWEDNKSFGKQSFNTYSWSNHSGIEYAKINDEYLFLGEKPQFYALTDSYQKCIDKMNSHKDIIKLSVDDFFRKRDKSQIDDITKGELFKLLISIKNKLQSLPVYTKEANSKNFLLGDISKLIEKLRK